MKKAKEVEAFRNFYTNFIRFFSCSFNTKFKSKLNQNYMRLERKTWKHGRPSTLGQWL